jgi:hypothetical protein
VQNAFKAALKAAKKHLVKVAPVRALVKFGL